MATDEFSLEEIESLGLGYPEQKQKEGIFTFLNKVLIAKDTIKVGNLDTEELRVVRLLRDASNFSKVFGLDDISQYFLEEGEVILASSDSKNGFLVSTAVTQKKQLETKTRNKSEGGGFRLWGKKKEQEVQE